MSYKSNTERIDVKRLKLQDNNEKITSFDATYSELVVHCFKNKCMVFYTKKLDETNELAYNTFIYTGIIVKPIFVKFVLLTYLV